MLVVAGDRDAVSQSSGHTVGDVASFDSNDDDDKDDDEELSLSYASLFPMTLPVTGFNRLHNHWPCRAPTPELLKIPKRLCFVHGHSQVDGFRL